MIITLKSIEKGVFNVKTRQATGEINYRQFSVQELYNYVQSCECFCECNGYTLHWIIPDPIKKVCGKWLETLAMNDNKNKS